MNRAPTDLVLSCIAVCAVTLGGVYAAEPTTSGSIEVKAGSVSVVVPFEPFDEATFSEGAVDSDADGLTDRDEIQFGTSKNVSDSDQDGLPDAWEVQNGRNPNVAGSDSDSDHDGIADIDEHRRGTDPNSADFNAEVPHFFAIPVGPIPAADSEGAQISYVWMNQKEEILIRYKWQWAVWRAGTLVNIEDLNLPHEPTTVLPFVDPHHQLFGSRGNVLRQVYWSNTGLQDLYAIVGPSKRQVFALDKAQKSLSIDDRDVVAGMKWDADSYGTRAWVGPTGSPMPTLGAWFSEIHSRNSLGDSAGLVFEYHNYWDGRSAVYWPRTGGVVEIPLPVSPYIDEAPHRVFGINDRGSVVGVSYLNGVPRAFQWQVESNTVTWLTAPDEQSSEDTYPFSINNRGDIVGSGPSGPVLWRDGVPHDLATRLAQPEILHLDDWYHEWLPLQIDNSGRILLASYDYSTETYEQIYLLVPSVKLGVDGNRDGELSFSEADQTSQAAPLRFWLNDDIDREDTSYCVISNGEIETEEDDLNAGAKDCDDTIINSKRDLEDLARLHLYVSGLTDAIKAGQLKLAFAWKNTTGSPSVRIFRAADTQNGSDSYIREDAVARTQMLLYQGHVPPDSVNEFGRSLGVVASGQELALDPASRVYDALSNTQPKMFLLFEGVSEGSGQLVLLIKDAQGQTIGEGPGVWLDLKNIKSMYERWTLGENDQVAPTTSATREGFNYAAPTKHEEKDYVLYVHGYNMPSWEKERWAETTFKRLWHLGYKGRVGILKWPCTNPGCVTDNALNGDVTFFDRSEHRAWQSGPGFLDCVQKLSGLGYAGRVRVLAHSQGNVVAAEGLRLAGANSSVVHTYVASQAALAAHCFDPSSQWDMPFESSYEDGTPNVYARYWVSDANPPQSDRFPKTWPATNPSYMAPGTMTGAAGKYVNFYNPDDFALGSWLFNQKTKPDGGYMTYSDAEGFRSYVNSHTGPIYTNLTFTADRYEVFAYGAEARSYALGACATGGVFAQTKDLKASLGYNERHIYHSAQFRNNLPNRIGYWEALLDQFGLGGL